MSSKMSATCSSSAHVFSGGAHTPCAHTSYGGRSGHYATRASWFYVRTRAHKNQRLLIIGSQPEGDCRLHADPASAASGARTSIDACAAASGAAAAALVMMEAAAGAAEDSSAIEGRSAMVRPRDCTRGSDDAGAKAAVSCALATNSSTSESERAMEAIQSDSFTNGLRSAGLGDGRVRHTGDAAAGAEVWRVGRLLPTL